MHLNDKIDNKIMLKDVFGAVSPLNILKKINKPVYDNSIFQLHYRFTVIILIFSSVLISTKQFFGDPIQCIGDKKRIGDAGDIFCWIHGTFTLRNQYAKERIGLNAAHPGVRSPINFDEEIHHKYYQWVCIILFLQAAMFFLPHYIWKIWEGNRISTLSSELRTIMLIPTKWTESHKNDMVRYFLEPNGHTFYTIRFLICEILNFANVVGQIFLLNSFLGVSFQNYGPVVASFYFQSKNYNTTDPMAWMFPKVTKCIIQIYGPSGSLQPFDLMCILPLNIVNEKLYALLWFWFMILALISGIAVIYRILTFISPRLRVYLLKSQINSLPKYQIIHIVRKFTIGDWFVLSQLRKNVNENVIKELIIELNREFYFRKSIPN